MYSGEHCQECGLPVVFFTRSWWNTDDDLWLRVMGDQYGILCPPCFTEAARRVGVLVHWKAVESA